MRQITKRLKSGQDLRQEIEKILDDENVVAGVVVSAVGSLSRAELRMPEAKNFLTLEEPLEIISVGGTVSKHGLHLHFDVSDKKGQVYGGHLNYGSQIRTTVELVILAFDDVEYAREKDNETGFDELGVRPKR